MSRGFRLPAHDQVVLPSDPRRAFSDIAGRRFSTTWSKIPLRLSRAQSIFHNLGISCGNDPLVGDNQGLGSVQDLASSPHF